jgi:Asp-tRNA(Asn)/Glu-tRNA(Gln) amidotransferase A subunit family amidase
VTRGADEICFLSAVELAAAVKERILSPVEIVEAVLERIETVDGELNSYCTVTAEAARSAARAAERVVMAGDAVGPLHGVPVSVKDLVFTRGVRTTRGSLVFSDFVPREDAPVVERLLGAGAIVVGKTNTPEFGWKGATNNRVFGPSRNPWDTTRTPGGSSGGSAAAVAAGLAPLSVGSDGAGSIRIPASYCGIVGLKPSFGRVPYSPPSPAGTLSHLGPMTRTVADCALMLEVIAGPDERDRHSLPRTGEHFAEAAAESVTARRIGWSTDFGYVRVDPQVRELTRAAAQHISEELGCEVEEADPGFADPATALDRMFYGGIGSWVDEHWDEWHELLDPGLAKMVERARRWTGLEMAQAHREAATVWESLRKYFERYDALITPTLPAPAFAVELDRPAGTEGLGWTPFTYPFNLTGLPAISVPCGWTSEGLPVGLQMVGPRYADADVLRLAAAYEAVAPWRHRLPKKASPGLRTED